MLLVTTQLVTVLVMFTYLPLAGAILQKKKKKNTVNNGQFMDK